MAVQPLLNSKIIIKKDTAILVSDNDSKQKEVNHKQIKKYTSIYEEPYFNTTGNIDVDELATAITARMVGGQVRIPETKAVEVDIKREIAIGKIDQNAVKSQVFKGKVNNKVEQLKALRNK
tara:strand:- start:508 stop:870 length:363 start_codon:yes stop_codon:yes gene_type:complete